jgi:SpoVK/Ycf46/Vps4 family AAA+-type ATPase
MALSAIDFDGIFRSFLPVDLYTFSLRLQKRLQQNKGELKLPYLLEDELNRFVPKNRDSSLAESTPSEALWEEIGGLLNAKEELLNTVFRPLVYRRIYERSRVRLPRGILLFGPSGCGKSFIVPALAQLCRLPLIMCRGPELLDRYIGGSEAKVRELFSRAYRAAPCILLMDEFDALAPKRGSDSTGVTDRVVNQLLTFLDGVEDVSASSTVYIIATSCRPDKIDPALLRPGRLEKHIHIGLPENREEMIDVIRKIAKKYSLGPRVLDSYCSSIDWASRIMSPADVRAVFQSAHILALQHELSSNPKSAQDICIDKSQLQSAFSHVRNSLSKDDSVYYAKMRAHFGKKTSRTDLAHSEEARAVPLRTALK